jgi:chemotaxis protein methyltransferase CheR
MPSLGPEECKLLAGYIQSICGIQLDHTKHYLIENRLRFLLEKTKSVSYRELYHKAKSDTRRDIERAIIDAVTTGETSFFRDGAPFDLLRHKIVPDLIDRRLRAAWDKIPIRIWSAASSTGQEVYSIAIVLHELLGGSDKYNIRLLGTDVSVQATARASAGIYKDVEIERGMPANVMGRYFVKRENGWQVRDDIRAMASFRTLNLLRDFSMLGQFDIIFCRNVAIYFSDQDKAALFARLAKSLAPDGYLIIGSTESLGNVAASFETRQYMRSVFYQRADISSSAARTA